MRSVKKAALSVVSAAALAVGLAGPAMASNEVRVKVDPLNWEWSGNVFLYSALYNRSSGETIPFTVQPGGGPQQVAATDIGTLAGSQAVDIADGLLTAPGGAQKIPYEYQLGIVNMPFLRMDIASDLNRTFPPADVDPSLTQEIKYSFTKQTDPTTDSGFYELKFFPSSDAPAAPPADLALQNLHETQSEGVAACDVARTLAPGDELTTGDANDTVCVTVDDGGDSSNAPIKIDTGDGNDTVLIDGDTGASVEVDTGRGNDVVVADTDADVDVTTGDGHDAVVDGGNTGVTDSKISDHVLAVK